MGACSSGEATSADAYPDDDQAMNDNRRMTYDKKTEEVVER